MYGELLPLVNSGRVELLDDQRLLTQLATFERRSGRSGKDSVDHAPGSHDDVANAAAGAYVLAAKGGRRPYWDEHYQCFRPDVGLSMGRRTPNMKENTA